MATIVTIIIIIILIVVTNGPSVGRVPPATEAARKVKTLSLQDYFQLITTNFQVMI